MLALYVDDTLATENPDFMKATDKIYENFESKPPYFSPFPFVGMTVQDDQQGYFVEQTEY